jgi:ubiquinone/menaquinone biosynthesis C-methylase UbiE
MIRRTLLKAIPGAAVGLGLPGQQLTSGWETSWQFWQPHETALINSLPIKPDMRILDAGCGRGDHLLLFTQKLNRQGQLVGLDKNQKSLDLAKSRLAALSTQSVNRPETIVQQADLLQLAEWQGRFDLVWSSHVLHAIADLPKVANQLVTTLAPQGRLVIRENRVSATLLPTDIGYGPPGLEIRANQAFQDWLIKDREKLGRYGGGWLKLLQDSGLQEVTSRSFLFEVNPPFSPVQEAYLRGYLRRRAELEELSSEDRQLLLKISELNTDYDVFRRKDLHYVSVSTIYVGTKTRR